MCYGNVQHMVVSTSWSTGDAWGTSSHLVVSRRRPLCWIVSCGSINAILRLTELYIRCVGVKKD